MLRRQFLSTISSVIVPALIGLKTSGVFAQDNRHESEFAVPLGNGFYLVNNWVLKDSDILNHQRK